MTETETGQFVIECNECARGDSEHREDCVVSFILDRPPGAIVFDAAEERALRALARAGLLPEARLKRRTG